MLADLGKVLSPQRQWGDVRRKQESAALAFGVATHSGDKDQQAVRPLTEHKSEQPAAETQSSTSASTESPPPSTSTDALPANMCPDGSEALNGLEGRPLVCGAGRAFDGFDLCPRGFYCSMDAERGSRLCCPLEIQASNVPPPPVIAPYLGHRRANPGESIGRGSLPSDRRRA